MILLRGGFFAASCTHPGVFQSVVGFSVAAWSSSELFCSLHCNISFFPSPILVLCKGRGFAFSSPGCCADISCHFAFTISLNSLPSPDSLLFIRCNLNCLFLSSRSSQSIHILTPTSSCPVIFHYWLEHSLSFSNFFLDFRNKRLISQQRF